MFILPWRLLNSKSGYRDNQRRCHTFYQDPLERPCQDEDVGCTAVLDPARAPRPSAEADRPEDRVGETKRGKRRGGGRETRTGPKERVRVPSRTEGSRCGAEVFPERTLRGAGRGLPTAGTSRTPHTLLAGLPTWPLSGQLPPTSHTQLPPCTPSSPFTLAFTPTFAFAFGAANTP